MHILSLYILAYIGSHLMTGFLSPIATWLIEGGN